MKTKADKLLQISRCVFVYVGLYMLATVSSYKNIYIER